MRRQMPRDAAGVNLGVIITPFLDMSFQILAFFIMTYHPSALEGHIDGSLALPARPGQAPGDDMKPPVTEVDLEDSVSVRLESTAGGEPSRLLVKRTLDAAFQTIADETESFPHGLKLLTARLKAIAAAAPETVAVKLEADGALRQQHIMLVYDVCRKAGFAKVAFVPPPAPH